MESWRTVAEVARLLGRSDSTVRSWARRFGDVIPTGTDDAGATIYPLAAFQVIDRMASQRRSTEAIRAEVARRSDAPEPRPEPTLADVLDELRAIRRAVERIADRLDGPG